MSAVAQKLQRVKKWLKRHPFGEHAEDAHWHVAVQIDKQNTPESIASGIPDEIYKNNGNLALDVGVNLLWQVLSNDSAAHFDEASSVLWVGDSATAASASQTGLQAPTNKLGKSMEAGYPITGAAQKIVFRAQFGTAEANFVWNEWGVTNGATFLNRKVDSMGTKASGAIWTFTVEISIVNP